MGSFKPGIASLLHVSIVVVALLQLSSAQTNPPSSGDATATAAVFATDFESTDAELQRCPKDKVRT